jgi:SOS response regulatory protein OraA/RecX
MKRTKETYRELIRTVLQAMQNHYEQLGQEERGQIRKEDWERNDEFNVLSEISMIDELVSGYASTIDFRGTIGNVEEALTKLKDADFLENSRFAEWYFSKREEYPHLIRSVELADYLRLLCIEYLSKFQSTETE